MCGTHGYCTGAAHATSFAAACQCDPNYVTASNCTVKQCQVGINCIHGKCVDDDPMSVTPWNPVESSSEQYAQVMMMGGSDPSGGEEAAASPSPLPS